MYHFRLRLGLVLAAALLCAAASETAQAQQDDQAASELDLTSIRDALQSGNQQRMLAALERVAAAGEDGKAAAPYVEELLRRGASTLVTVGALNVAAKLDQESSSAAIAPYVRHRSGVLREAAAHALVQTGGPAAVRGLRLGLRSSDASVRVISAVGLGRLGAREAVGDLFQALDRQVFEAAVSIGTMCSPSECKRLAGLLGKQPLSVMLRGLDQVLFRPAEQIPDEAKLTVIERLRELGTMEVGSYMASASQRWPKQWSKPVKEAIDTAAKALGASVEGK